MGQYTELFEPSSECLLLNLSIISSKFASDNTETLFTWRRNGVKL